MPRSICKIHLMILGLVLGATINAQAAQQCRTVAECQARIAQDQATLRALQAGQAPTFLDIAKNADGTVKYMNQNDAIQYCTAQGAHLPSARELAQLSMSLGAKGIAEIKSGKPDNSYYSINAKNADGSSDKFYFSNEGYQRPAGEMGNNWFWSSSVFSYSSYYAFFFSGYFGGVFSDSRYYYGAVLCVSGR